MLYLHNTIPAYRLSKMMMMNMKVCDHFFINVAKLAPFLVLQNFSFSAYTIKIFKNTMKRVLY